MTKRIGLLTACVIFIIAGIARAVTLPATDITLPVKDKFSLDDCITIALSNQSDILIGQNSVESAKARETQAKSGYYPQVSAQRSGSHVDSSADGRSGANESASLSISQNIYDGGLREAKVTGARASTDQSVYGLARTRQTTVFNVTKSYFALLRAKTLSGVQEERVKYLEEQLDLVKARVSLGDAAEVDALPIEAQLAGAHVDRLSAKNDVENAAVALQSAMGLAPQPVFDVLDSDIPTDKEMQNMDIYINKALDERPEIKRALASVTSANSSVKSARISLRPRPSITGEYDKSLMNGEDSAFTLSGGFVFDLFDGGSNRAAYRDARLGLSNAEINAAQAAKDIQAQVQQAYLNLASSKERMAASDISLNAAQKNYDVQEARYKQGLAIPLDLLNAQLQLVSARSNLAQSRYDYYTSLAQLEYVTGAWGGSK
ncbi:MAG: TolC family protein [bacterium]